MSFLIKCNRVGLISFFTFTFSLPCLSFVDRNLDQGVKCVIFLSQLDFFH